MDNTGKGTDTQACRVPFPSVTLIRGGGGVGVFGVENTFGFILRWPGGLEVLSWARQRGVLRIQ